MCNPQLRRLYKNIQAKTFPSVTRLRLLAQDKSVKEAVHEFCCHDNRQFCSCMNACDNRSSDSFYYRCKKQILEMNVRNIIGLFICLLCIGGAWKIQGDSGKAISSAEDSDPEVFLLNHLALQNIMALKILEKEETKNQKRKKAYKKDAIPILHVKEPFCDPENITVSLDIKPELGKTVWPTHVRLLRCGGCCKQDYRSCQPTVKKKYKVKVRKFVVDRRSRHKRREHFYVDVEQHMACACKCKENTDCNPVIHIFDKKTCSCNCRNKAEKLSTCRQIHMWDDVGCRCICRDHKICSGSEYFDHESCTCKSLFEGVSISGLE